MEKISKDKIIEEHKKVIYRFLKESGFLTAFKRYLKHSPAATFNVTEYIDDALGNSFFTFYLSRVEGVELPTTFSDIFRAYVEIMYGGKYKTRYKTCEDLRKVYNIIINEKTGTIEIPYITHEKQRRN